MTCTRGERSIEVEGNQASFPTVSNGDQYVCTYTNTKDVTSITVDKQVPATVVPGATMTYTIGWAVNGNTTATNATVTDAIPANTTFVAADNGGTFAANAVTWNLGTQQPGANGTVTVTVKVEQPAG